MADKTDFERILSLISEDDFESEEECVEPEQPPPISYAGALMQGIRQGEPRSCKLISLFDEPDRPTHKERKLTRELSLNSDDGLPKTLERFSEKPVSERDYIATKSSTSKHLAAMQDRLLLEACVGDEDSELHEEFDSATSARHEWAMRKRERKLRKMNAVERKSVPKKGGKGQKILIHPPELEESEDEDGCPTLRMFCVPEFYSIRKRPGRCRAMGGKSSGKINWGTYSDQTEQALKDFVQIYLQTERKQSASSITPILREMQYNLPTFYDEVNDPIELSMTNNNAIQSNLPPPTNISHMTPANFTPLGSPVQFGRSPVNDNVFRLYHGTLWNSAESIMRSGFRMPSDRSGNEAKFAPVGRNMVRPHMFGKGIYFTTNAEKASHFGDTLVVCDVALGRWKPVHEANYGISKSTLVREGFDSVYAAPGSGGNVFDEYVVFDPYQVSVVGYSKRR